MPREGRGLPLAALETLFESAPLGMALIDRTFHYLRVNAALARFNGVSAEAHAGRAVADVVPHFWPALKPLFHRALAGETIANWEITGRSADSPGEVLHRRVSCHPVRVDREVIALGILSTDLYRERRAETQASRLAAIIESSDDAIVARTLDGIITNWNKGAERMFGYVAEEIVGSPITRLIPAHRHDEERRVLEAIRRDERIEPFETVRQAKNGRLIDVSIAVSPIRDSAGRVVGASKTARDITERRRTSETLAQSERQLRALAEELTTERAHLLAAQSVARMGSWSTDLRTMAVIWSAETHRIFGTNPATFVPTHAEFLARVHPADRAAVGGAFVGSFESGGSSTITHRVTMADGQVRWVEETWRVTHADDAPLRALGTVQDITERKEAEERVRASDARLRAVLNHAPVVIFAVDDQGTFTLSEGRGLESLGLAPGEIVGRSATELYGKVELVQTSGVVISGEDALRRALAGDSVSGLMQLGPEYFETYLAPDRDGDGRVAGVIGVSMEVTARRQAELALRDSEARLRQSTAALQALSVRLNEAREQERGTMARDIHDHLGQALTALKMDVAEVCRRLDAGDTAVIRERLGEMSALIDTAVDDVRRVAAELRPVVLDDLGFIGAVRGYLIDVERRSMMRCLLRTPLADLAIAGDRATALFRILQEALTNVVRHAEATRVDVCLTLDAGQVRLVVRDNGRGMPPAAVGNPRSLGLTGMRDRAVLAGGDITVASRPGEGTSVTVQLPVDGAAT